MGTGSCPDSPGISPVKDASQPLWAIWPLESDQELFCHQSDRLVTVNGHLANVSVLSDFPLLALIDTQEFAISLQSDMAGVQETLPVISLVPHKLALDFLPHVITTDSNLCFAFLLGKDCATSNTHPETLPPQRRKPPAKRKL